MSEEVARQAPSPTRRSVLTAVAAVTKRRNYALLFPTSPTTTTPLTHSPTHSSTHSPTPSTPSTARGSLTTSPRARSSRFLIETTPNKQDSDGAVEKKSTVVFQSNVSLIQMINTGEACFFDNLTPYIPIKLTRFCFLWLSDDDSVLSSSHNSVNCSSKPIITDRSIWIYPSYVELNWKTEIIDASVKWKSALSSNKKKPPMNPRLSSFNITAKQRANCEDVKEMQQHTHKFGFLQLLWHFMGTTQETQLTKAVKLFTALHAQYGLSGVADPLQASEPSETLSFPPRNYLSDGRPAVCVYETLKRHNNDILDVEVLESTGDVPFCVELKVKVQPVASLRKGTDIVQQSPETHNANRKSLLSRNIKYKRPYFYLIDEEDIRSFLFDKDEYSVDNFGICCADNDLANDYDNTFFGKVIEGLGFDTELNSLSVDFLDRLKIAKYYKEAVSAGEKVIISKIYDDRKMEAAMRESVSKMEEYERLNKLPEQNITLTSIYRSFIEADTVKSTDDVKDSDADAFDIDALMLPIRDNVEAAYVKQFNSDVMKKLSLKEKEKAVRMEILMRKFALVDTKDYTTSEDHHLYDRVPMPVYSTFVTKTSKVLYGLATRSSPLTIAQIREALMTSIMNRSASMKSNMFNFLLRTKGLSEHLALCSQHSLEQIANSCSFVQLCDKDKLLASEGEYFDCCFIVLSGSVNIVKWRSKKLVKQQGAGIGKVKYKRYSTTKLINKGELVGEDSLRGKHCWRFDVSTAVGGASLCLLPIQAIRKYIGTVNSTSRNFIKCFWKFHQIWEYTKVKHEEKVIHHFDDGLSDKLEHVESSSYFFRGSSVDNASTFPFGPNADRYFENLSSHGESIAVASQDELQRWLTDRAYIRYYRPGEVIFQQGSESHLLYVVLTGECCHARKIKSVLPGAGYANDDQVNHPCVVEVDIGLNLYPGHFVIDITDDQLHKIVKGNTPKTYKNENAILHDQFEKWEESMGVKVKRDKTRNTIIDNNRFGFSILSESTLELEAAVTNYKEDCGEDDTIDPHYDKRSGVFKKTFLTSLADHDYSLTTALYGTHRNSLIAKTYCEICVLPLSDIAKCPVLFFDKLVDKCKATNSKAFVTNDELISAYKSNLESSISHTQEKLNILQDIQKHKAQPISSEKLCSFTDNQLRLKTEMSDYKKQLQKLRDAGFIPGKS